MSTIKNFLMKKTLSKRLPSIINAKYNFNGTCRQCGLSKLLNNLRICKQCNISNDLRENDSLNIKKNIDDYALFRNTFIKNLTANAPSKSVSENMELLAELERYKLETARVKSFFNNDSVNDKVAAYKRNLVRAAISNSTTPGNLGGPTKNIIMPPGTDVDPGGQPYQTNQKSVADDFTPNPQLKNKFVLGPLNDNQKKQDAMVVNTITPPNQTLNEKITNYNDLSEEAKILANLEIETAVLGYQSSIRKRMVELFGDGISKYFPAVVPNYTDFAALFDMGYLTFAYTGQDVFPGHITQLGRKVNQSVFFNAKSWGLETKSFDASIQGVFTEPFPYAAIVKNITGQKTLLIPFSQYTFMLAAYARWKAGGIIPLFWRTVDYFWTKTAAKFGERLTAAINLGFANYKIQAIDTAKKRGLPPWFTEILYDAGPGIINDAFNEYMGLNEQQSTEVKSLALAYALGLQVKQKTVDKKVLALSSAILADHDLLMATYTETEVYITQNIKGTVNLELSADLGILALPDY